MPRGLMVPRATARAVSGGGVLVAALLLLACGPPGPGEGVTEEADGRGVSAVTAGIGEGPDFSGGEWIDLTHPFTEDAIYWPTARGFELDTVAWGMTEGGWFYSAFDFSAAEHGGTHLDAPLHFAEGRHATDEIPLERLIGPAVVVEPMREISPSYEVSVADLRAWEERHGRIPDGSILLLRTGWGSRYGDAEAYLGTARRGPEAVPELDFPGLHPEAARWLVDERDVAAVGIDTPSIDRGRSTTFESHVVLYSENVPGFENVAALDRLPPVGSHVFALPMKIAGGSGGPLRIVAWVPHRVVD